MESEYILKLALALVVFAHIMAYCFVTWYPFRHEGVGFVPGGIGFFIGAFITLFLQIKTNTPEYVQLSLPFGLAAISFLCFRRMKPKSKQGVGANGERHGE